MLSANTLSDDGLASPGQTLSSPKARDPRTALFVRGLLAASAATSSAVAELGKRLIARRHGPAA